MKSILIVAAAALVSATPSLAKTDESSEEKIICKRDRAPALGSNLRRSGSKTCMRESEWKELEALNERAKMRIQDKMRGGPAPVVGIGASGN